MPLRWSLALKQRYVVLGTQYLYFEYLIHPDSTILVDCRTPEASRSVTTSSTRKTRSPAGGRRSVSSAERRSVTSPAWMMEKSMSSAWQRSMSKDKVNRSSRWSRSLPSIRLVRTNSFISPHSAAVGLIQLNFPWLHLTCSWWVSIYVGKPSAVGQLTRPTQHFILSGSINE